MSMGLQRQKRVDDSRIELDICQTGVWNVAVTSSTYKLQVYTRYEIAEPSAFNVAVQLKPNMR